MNGMSSNGTTRLLVRLAYANPECLDRYGTREPGYATRPARITDASTWFEEVTPDEAERLRAQGATVREANGNGSCFLCSNPPRPPTDPTRAFATSQTSPEGSPLR